MFFFLMYRLPPRSTRTDTLFPYTTLSRSRRSIGFVVADDGLRVTAPTWVTLAQIDDAVREKARWILAKLRDWQARNEQLALAQTRRSEEHTSELQSLMRISYAVFCLKKTKTRLIQQIMTLHDYKKLI